MTHALTTARSAGLISDPNQPTTTTTSEVNETTARALERISVTAPYFAFDDLDLDPIGAVRASVPSAPPTDTERGVMIADQIARHLAILGSCAAALGRDDDARHHYLATVAQYERHNVDLTAPIETGLWARAVADWQDKRTVVADTELRTDDGTLLNRLRVQYAVLKPRMFERFNPPIDSSGHAPTDELTIVEPGQVVRDCGGIAEAMCAGHFPGHPAAPVALLMGRLVATTADAMSSQLGQSVDYIVEGGTVEATGLAQAGQHLVLHGQYDEPESDDLHRLSGTAKADGETVGTVSVLLRSVPRDD